MSETSGVPVQPFPAGIYCSFRHLMHHTSLPRIQNPILQLFTSIHHPYIYKKYENKIT